ncbi:MAG: flavoprotein [Planctomycetota bacterium]
MKARQKPNSARPTTGKSVGNQPTLAGYEVLVCISGGIAAYKTATLTSSLVQSGCGVTVALTRNGRRFIGETTFRALTGRPTYTNMWRRTSPVEFQHLALCERADLILVAPATANIIGKLASGIADDLVSTLLLGADSPVMLAPAMNTRMWLNPAVQRNIELLRDSSIILVGPDEGWLACGDTGPGRMTEPEVLFETVSEQLLCNPPKQRSSAVSPS